MPRRMAMSLGFYKCVEEKICQGLFLGPKNMYMVYVLYIYGTCGPQNHAK